MIENKTTNIYFLEKEFDFCSFFRTFLSFAAIKEKK